MDITPSVTEIYPHFAECGLPIQIVDKNPRRIPRWAQPATPSIADFFTLDVLHNATPDQTFRLWASPDAEVQVTAKRAQTHHLLLQVRATPADQLERATLLLGHDERQLFVVNTRRVADVDSAIKLLKPPQVVWAERHGLKVIRQGDWFFVPVRANFQLPKRALTYRQAPIGRPSGAVSGHAHIAELQAIDPGEVVERWGRKERVGRAIYVQGKIRHSEHATVELTQWHQAVPNQPEPQLSPLRLGYAD